MNRWMINGRLTKDPEMKETKSGVLLAIVYVAIRREYKEKGTSEYKSDFFMLKAFDKKADFVHSYLQKGDLVSIEATIQHQSWEVDGERKYRDDYIVKNINKLASPQSKEPFSG